MHKQFGYSGRQAQTLMKVSHPLQACLIVCALGLAGCGRGERDTTYFMAHADEAEAIQAACARGEIKGDDCANASAALISLADDQVKPMPDVGSAR